MIVTMIRRMIPGIFPALKKTCTAKSAGSSKSRRISPGPDEDVPAATNTAVSAVRGTPISSDLNPSRISFMIFG